MPNVTGPHVRGTGAGPVGGLAGGLAHGVAGAGRVAGGLASLVVPGRGGGRLARREAPAGMVTATAASTRTGAHDGAAQVDGRGPPHTRGRRPASARSRNPGPRSGRTADPTSARLQRRPHEHLVDRDVRRLGERVDDRVGDVLGLERSTPSKRCAAIACIVVGVVAQELGLHRPRLDDRHADAAVRGPPGAGPRRSRPPPTSSCCRRRCRRWRRARRPRRR